MSLFISLHCTVRWLVQLFHHTNTDRFLSRLPVTPKASLVIIRNGEKQHIQPERSKKTGEKLILIIRKGDSVDTNHIPKEKRIIFCGLFQISEGLSNIKGR